MKNKNEKKGKISKRNRRKLRKFKEGGTPVDQNGNALSFDIEPLEVEVELEI